MSKTIRRVAVLAAAGALAVIGAGDIISTHAAPLAGDIISTHSVKQQTLAGEIINTQVTPAGDIISTH